MRADSEIALTKVFPRSVCDEGKANLHVFCDSSKNVYGAVAYLVSTVGSCKKSVLVSSKAKIVGKEGPKINTIPKLELMALVVSAKLAVYCSEALFQVDVETLYLWSDSRTALSWCSSYDIKEEFVSNRVRQIRECVPHTKLLFFPSNPVCLNPADILTRQPKAEKLLNNPLWWNGPEFLLQSTDDWPLQDPSYNLMPEETMKREFVSIQSDLSSNIAPKDRQFVPDLIKASKAYKEVGPAKVQDPILSLQVGA